MTFLNYKLEIHVWLLCVHGYRYVHMKFMFLNTQKQKCPPPPGTLQMLQVLSSKQENKRRPSDSTRREKHHLFFPRGQLWWGEGAVRFQNLSSCPARSAQLASHQWEGGEPCGTEVKPSGWPAFKSQLCHLLAAQPCAANLLHCRIGITGSSSTMPALKMHICSNMND